MAQSCDHHALNFFLCFICFHFLLALNLFLCFIQFCDHHRLISVLNSFLADVQSHQFESIHSFNSVTITVSFFFCICFWRLFSLNQFTQFIHSISPPSRSQFNPLNSIIFSLSHNFFNQLFSTPSTLSIHSINSFTYSLTSHKNHFFTRRSLRSHRATSDSE